MFTRALLTTLFYFTNQLFPILSTAHYIRYTLIYNVGFMINYGINEQCCCRNFSNCISGLIFVLFLAVLFFKYI